MPLVPLPSGALAPLETPGLLPLLSGGGSTLAMAQATLAHDEVDASDLTPEDAYAVALWGVLAFCETDEAVTLAATCEAFNEPPARRMSVCEPSLAWALDAGCLAALRERQAEAREEEPPPSKGGMTFSVPDTWEGDDD